MALTTHAHANRYYANYLKFMERARSRLVGMRRVAASQDPQVAAVAAGLRVSEMRERTSGVHEHGGVSERVSECVRGTDHADDD
jgi:hypothetical protein